MEKFKFLIQNDVSFDRYKTWDIHWKVTTLSVSDYNNVSKFCHENFTKGSDTILEFYSLLKIAWTFQIA